ncbi:MAG: CRISPR system precrRNA processing endoribonuclease RAMP protein Cas6 [Acidobacteriia bacterium]|nr:CRISPR system precrRNA processing endoribonuclease RAMP protein Cas6 [Methyloceanibacter sp.]MBX5472416.1 CRISPR system precrRNA processing endoribonuclease RAMP protein Cas6 [Acetobacteraceae bacterium]MCL6492688.1 CRISPR system precrRNA processing endoribonuclease RAMP protein Cas6 [Terriglobia bacterium]
MQASGQPSQGEPGSGIRFPPLYEARFVFASQELARFQRFPGSAWRGAFGTALKRLVCTMHLRPCPGCPLLGVCPFPQIFDPPADPETARHGLSRLRMPPYVLDPPETPRAGFFAAGEPIPVTLRLIGEAGRFGAYAALALVQAAERGIGPDRARLTLLHGNGESAPPRLHRLELPLPPLPPGPISVHFTTPLRLKIENDLCTPANLTPAHVLGAAVRRFSLACMHDAGLPPEADFRALKQAMQTLRWEETSLHWCETTRRSQRQGTLMRLGGIVGQARLDLAPAPALWPFLWFAQWLHLGKAATMGFGRIRLNTS